MATELRGVTVPERASDQDIQKAMQKLLSKAVVSAVSQAPNARLYRDGNRYFHDKTNPSELKIMFLNPVTEEDRNDVKKLVELVIEKTENIYGEKFNLHNTEEPKYHISSGGGSASALNYDLNLKANLEDSMRIGYSEEREWPNQQVQTVFAQFMAEVDYAKLKNSARAVCRDVNSYRCCVNPENPTECNIDLFPKSGVSFSDNHKTAFKELIEQLDANFGKLAIKDMRIPDDGNHMLIVVDAGNRAPAQKLVPYVDKLMSDIELKKERPNLRLVR